MSTKWGDWIDKSIQKSLPHKSEAIAGNRCMKTIVSYEQNCKGRVVKIINKVRVKVIKRKKNNLEGGRITWSKLESGVFDKLNSCFTVQNAEDIYFETLSLSKNDQKKNLFSKKMIQTGL